MEHKDFSANHQLLICLSCLPQKILSLYSADNITEFVLHELCSEHYLDIEQAAYFVDNPDFNCFVGVAGYSRSERYAEEESHWHSPDLFSDHMRKCGYNKKIRAINRTSFTKCNKNEQAIVDAIGQELGFTNPRCLKWNLKHNNHGILIINPSEQREQGLEDYLLKGLYLLGFCPIF
ncbi:MAG TPA: hypothetical protein VHA52_08440 [Candidatus Babeliaceae bacterium]|nr:hypothetical protein [Candidatus Babeliaceae bacterium]